MSEAEGGAEAAARAFDALPRAEKERLAREAGRLARGQEAPSRESLYAASQYAHCLLGMAIMDLLGRGESPSQDAIRDASDAHWRAMTEAQREASRELSAALVRWERDVKGEP